MVGYETLIKKRCLKQLWFCIDDNYICLTKLSEIVYRASKKSLVRLFKQKKKTKILNYLCT